MAGSYEHITDDEGHFEGTDLLDNLGDAHEALEECYGMIWYLAFQAAGNDRPKALELVAEAADNYELGLSFGGKAKDAGER